MEQLFYRGLSMGLELFLGTRSHYGTVGFHFGPKFMELVKKLAFAS